jgi:hypothetical protein
MKLTISQKLAGLNVAGQMTALGGLPGSVLRIHRLHRLHAQAAKPGNE